MGKAYIEAKKEVGRTYEMKTNFRSSPTAVEAVNKVFALDNIFGDDSPIKYANVSAAKKSEEYALLRNGSVFPGMLVREVPNKDENGKNLKTDVVKELLTGHILQTISEMIKKDSSFKIREKVTNEEGRDEISEKPVKPSDIAVLVAKNDFALEIYEKLKDADIPAAVETDTAKELYIFFSEEALAIQKLISAASTNGIAEFKTLLLTFFYNKTVDDIASDNISFSKLHENFRSCFGEWDKKGFYPAFSKFIEDKNILDNIALKNQKTKKTFGILHQLAELIHKHECEKGFSVFETEQWFNDKIKSKNGSVDKNIRDEGGKKECVRIMTLHKSKGLEFNIVFFPFMLNSNKKQWTTRHRKTDSGYEREIIFMSASEAKKKPKEMPQDDEKLEENRRIYVGLTRAKYLTVCYTQPQKKLLEPTSLFERKNEKTINIHQLTNCNYKTIRLEKKDEAVSTKEFLQAETAWREIEPEWMISSYSSINSREQNESRTFGNENVDPDGSADRQTQERTSKKELPLGDFPGGAAAGLVLHEIFEKADFQNDNEKLIMSILQKKMNFEEKADEKSEKSELERMTEDVKLCLTNVCSAPIFENGKTLFDIPGSDKIAEMEFFIKIENKKLEKRNLSKIISDDHKTEELDDGTVKQGFLHGFIDLVAKIEGKYYIIDWKSNNLGSRFADYENDGLVKEMKKHNYYLQYMLYLAAFDNYMTTVDPEYSYEKNFGGIKYVFLRGVKEGSNKTGIFQDRPDEQKLRKIQRLLEGKE